MRIKKEKGGLIGPFPEVKTLGDKSGYFPEVETLGDKFEFGQRGRATTRWTTDLSSKVNLPHAINFEAVCSTNSDMLPTQFWRSESFVLHRAGSITPDGGAGVNDASNTEVDLPPVSDGRDTCSHHQRTSEYQRCWQVWPQIK